MERIAVYHRKNPVSGEIHLPNYETLARLAAKKKRQIAQSPEQQYLGERPTRIAVSRNHHTRTLESSITENRSARVALSMYSSYQR